MLAFIEDVSQQIDNQINKFNNTICSYFDAFGSQYPAIPSIDGRLQK